MQPTGSGNIQFSPARITYTLLLCMGLLLLGHLAAFIEDYVRHATSRTAKNIIRWFDFNLEHNVPTWFSVILLTLSMLLLLLIYLHHRNNRDQGAHYWLVLAFIFLFLSMDEMVQVHEEVARILRPELGENVPSIFYWAWVIPYGIFTMLAGLYFMRFVIGLPAVTRRLFILSGILFIGGALGLELIEGYFYVRYSLNHIYNRILYCMEELCEMGGIILFIHALLLYIETHRISVSAGRD